jgi:hypothetical protein
MKIENKTVPSSTVTYYITEDGKKFNNEESALEHERELEDKKFFDNLTIKFCDFAENIVDDRDLVTSFWIKINNSHELELFNKFHPYFPDKQLSVPLNEWICVCQYEWDSNGLNRYSGTDYKIYTKQEMINLIVGKVKYLNSSKELILGELK